MKDLRGRLETVHVSERQLTADIFYGRLAKKGGTVLVKNGYMCPGKVCLARFSASPDEKGVCNFITADIAHHFYSFSAEEYVLCGLWANLPKRAGVPSLREIETYFDAGDMESALYFAESSSSYHGRYFIKRKSAYPLKRFAYREIFRNRTIAEKRRARVIVLESKKELEKLENAFLKSHTLNLILMQPLS